jgi:hypothetical protein
LGLKNVQPLVARAETLSHEHDFITGRAVSDLRTFVHQTKQLIIHGLRHSLPNGILYWQGVILLLKKLKVVLAHFSVMNCVRYSGTMKNFKENG